MEENETLVNILEDKLGSPLPSLLGKKNRKTSANSFVIESPDYILRQTTNF